MTADAVGGVWQYALDAAHGLKAHGVGTVLATLGPRPSADQREAAGRAGIADLVETDLPLDWTADAPEAVRAAGEAVARLAAEHRPDIVHLNSPALAGVARFPAPVVAVCHSCVATWWAAMRAEPLPADFAWRTDLVRRGYAAAAALAAPTKAFAEATARAYGLAQAPRVVRNGRRAPAAAAPAADPEAAVFTAGRLWDEGKNLATLDRAAARLALPVEAAGPTEGPNGARIALAHVRTIGRLEDAAIAARLARRPIVVSVARYEPFGLAVLEAAQAACALVLSDIPTFRELWDGAALFVEPEDDGAVAAAVQRLVGDPGLRERLGRAAEARSRAYSVEAMSAGLAALYRTLLAGRPAEIEAA
ncbi:MAG TPA: glycosyltransferase family 4 protein [Microvirga sp.]|jgi:glycosyltransferase involved in cell wall biosynthesis|nr:glycosyltransferase family 4 protein [Microvirga sp.]